MKKFYTLVKMCVIVNALFLLTTSAEAQHYMTPNASAVDTLQHAYSGTYDWDADTKTVTFLSSGTLRFAHRIDSTHNIWHIPDSVKKVFINANVTVTGQFTAGHDMVFEGEDKFTSVVYGTDFPSVLHDAEYDTEHTCIAYSSFYAYHSGDVYINNLTCLNPLGFMFTGKGGCRMHLDHVLGIDTRGGNHNHSDGISSADGSTVKNSYMATGDDAIKVYSDITVVNSTIKMVRNCVPIQYTWAKYGSGKTGTFENVAITGIEGRGSKRFVFNVASSDAGSPYYKAINMNGCIIENPNAMLFYFKDNSISSDVTIENSRIDVKEFGTNFGQGNINICGQQITNSSTADFSCETPSSKTYNIPGQLEAENFSRASRSLSRQATAYEGIAIQSFLFNDTAYYNIKVNQSADYILTTRYFNVTNQIGGSIDFYIEEDAIGTVNTSYTIGVTGWFVNAIDTVQLTEGEHVLKVVGQGDASLNYFDFKLANPACEGNTPPVCYISSPAAGGFKEIGEQVNITAQAFDNSSVTKVEFYNGTEKLGEDASSPYTYALTGTQEGTYNIIAIAYDDCGVSAQSAVMPIVVSGTSGVLNNNLTALVTKDGEMSLKWDNLYAGVTGYSIERSIAGEDNYVEIGTALSNDSTYVDDTGDEFQLYHYRMVASFDAILPKVGAPVLARKPYSTHPDLPDSWTAITLGDTLIGHACATTYNNGIFTMDAGEGDFWGTADRGQFIYKRYTGDCEIKAQITSFTEAQGYTMAGVIIRESLNNDSKFATSFLINNPGAVMRERIETGGVCNQKPIPNTGEKAPYWVRIVRSGNTFTSYKSADGSAWTTIRSVTIDMAADIYIGFAGTSHTKEAIAEFTFEDVTITGTPTATLTILNSEGVTIYPNPVKDKLTIESEDVIASYYLYSTLGQLQVAKTNLQNNKITIETTGLQNGNYHLVIETEGGKRVSTPIVK